MLKKTEKSEAKTDTVVIKKYANRRLYNTETSTYVTLDDLAEMVRADRDFSVFDAKTGNDLTHGVLTQIIVDQESRGQTMLPVPFLRQLIRFYDDSISRMVPGYLQFSLEALAQEQERFSSQFSNAFGNPTAALDAYQDQVRRNMEIFERAMAMWSPFGTPVPGSELHESDGSSSATHPGASSAGQSGISARESASRDELAELKSQMESMQQKIDELSDGK